MHFRCNRVVQLIGSHAVIPRKQSHIQRVFQMNSATSFSNLGSSNKVHLFNMKFQLPKRFNYTSNVMFLLLINSLKNIPEILKSHSVKIVQNCVQSCEYVIAHRIRRSQQMLCLYSKLWDEISLRQLIHRLKAQIQRRKHILLLGSSFVSAYDWNKERIPDEEILKYSAEMSLIEFLRDKRKACLKGTSSPADCTCPVCTATDSEWQSFVEEDDIVVWKREDVNHRGQGLYCYKMYARYGDVTAYDFLEAQVDLEYRQSWDTHAVALRLIDSEPATNSDVIYWETKWPKLFSNRDYVFKRRYRIDKKRNLIYLVNRITEHPSCPVVTSKQRVSEYWSYMIIKPQTTFDKPGIEFSLTYFDNPGLNVPSTLTFWVTVSGMPDYLKKLRLAALGVAERRGNAPSPLASRHSSVCAVDVAASLAHAQQATSTATLLESLRGTLFLF
uniref:Phosphatidylcholine transfer protein n=1 Tax=Graphocephala atropunctata TaxID=36148 RepID=A0A1B6L3Z0_9HEMI